MRTLYQHFIFFRHRLFTLASRTTSGGPYFVYTAAFIVMVLIYSVPVLQVNPALLRFVISFTLVRSFIAVALPPLSSLKPIWCYFWNFTGRYFPLTAIYPITSILSLNLACIVLKKSNFVQRYQGRPEVPLQSQLSFNWLKKQAV